MSLKSRIEGFRKYLFSLEKVLEQPKDEFIRDSAIKRFELCFELCWKAIKDFLYSEGILCRSPKGCLKEAFLIGLIDDEEEWLEMLEDRNLAVHTYDESLAEDIYSRLKSHLLAMKEVLKKIQSG